MSKAKNPTNQTYIGQKQNKIEDDSFNALPKCDAQRSTLAEIKKKISNLQSWTLRS